MSSFMEINKCSFHDAPGSSEWISTRNIVLMIILVVQCLKTIDRIVSQTNWMENYGLFDLIQVSDSTSYSPKTKD